MNRKGTSRSLSWPSAYGLDSELLKFSETQPAPDQASPLFPACVQGVVSAFQASTTDSLGTGAEYHPSFTAPGIRGDRKGGAKVPLMDPQQHLRRSALPSARSDSPGAWLQWARSPCLGWRHICAHQRSLNGREESMCFSTRKVV